jgi:hypothetical protein
MNQPKSRVGPGVMLLLLLQLRKYESQPESRVGPSAMLLLWWSQLRKYEPRIK